MISFKCSRTTLKSVNTRLNPMPLRVPRHKETRLQYRLLYNVGLTTADLGLFAFVLARTVGTIGFLVGITILAIGFVLLVGLWLRIPRNERLSFWTPTAPMVWRDSFRKPFDSIA